MTITAQSVDALVALLDPDVRWGSDETSESTCGSRAQVESFLRESLIPLSPISLVLLAVRPRALLVGWYSERNDIDAAEQVSGLLVLAVSPAATISDIRVPEGLDDAYARISEPGTAYVDVLSVPDCPHVSEAILAVRSAAAAAEMLPVEVDVRVIGSPGAAELARFPGSPLVRVNGVTIGPTAHTTAFGTSCLIQDQVAGEADIRAALGRL